MSFKKGNFSTSSLTVGFFIVGIGGIYGSITQDFKIGGFIIAIGGAIAALGDVLS
ncbi:hypothetical protein HY483_03875 [Candidatus Woesearchaeota archaeon]|nr:hypothetical protein [Candidatus Woesearchaeota archaeon]